MWHQWQKLVTYSVMAAVVATVCVSSALAADPDDGGRSEIIEQGVTKPSQERLLSFNNLGVVAKLNVKEGDTVKEKQLLAQQDLTVELAEMQLLQVQAESPVRIDAAEKELAVKKNDLKRVTEQHSEEVATDLELEKAQLEVVFGEASVKLAQQEQQEKKLQVAVQKAKIALKQLVSPTAGIVKKVYTHAGEVADPQRPSLLVVQNDPLYVDVDLPTAHAEALRVKQVLQVKYLDRDEWMDADVIFLNPTADPASGTRPVRLELRNKLKRESGLPVMVKVPSPVAAAKGAARPRPQAQARVRPMAQKAR